MRQRIIRFGQKHTGPAAFQASHDSPPWSIIRTSSGNSVVGTANPGFPTVFVGVRLPFEFVPSPAAGDLGLLGKTLLVSGLVPLELPLPLAFFSPPATPLAVGVTAGGVFFLLLPLPPPPLAPLGVGAAVVVADVPDEPLPAAAFLEPLGDVDFLPPALGDLRPPSPEDFLMRLLVFSPVVPMPAAAQASNRALTLGVLRDTAPDLRPSAITCGVIMIGKGHETVSRFASLLVVVRRAVDKKQRLQPLSLLLVVYLLFLLPYTWYLVCPLHNLNTAGCPFSHTELCTHIMYRTL